MLTLKWNKIN